MHRQVWNDYHNTHAHAHFFPTAFERRMRGSVYTSFPTLCECNQ